MNTKIQTFIQMLCEEFSLPQVAVEDVYTRAMGTVTEPASTEPAGDGEYTEASLNKLTVIMLKKILREQNKHISGRKAELIARILGTETAVASTPSRKKLGETTKKPKVSAKKRDETTLGRLYEANRPKVTVRTNSYGNHEHPETHLVFRGTPALVYGRQTETGEIEPVNEEIIDLCNQYAFQYEQPADLAAASQEEDVTTAVDAEIADVESAIRDLDNDDSEDEIEDDGGLL